MKYSSKTAVLVGCILAGSTLLTTSQAAAFGQQWRPASVAYAAPAYSAGSGFRRVANVPSFRPSQSAPRTRYSAAQVMRPLSARVDRTAAMVRPALSQRPMMPMQYAPRPVGYQARTAYPPAQGMWAGMPMWAQPFAQMTRAMPYPVPMPPRQFAWEPTERPMVSRQRAAQGWSTTRMAPTYRFDRRVSAAPLPAWRPTAPTQASWQPGLNPVASYRPARLARPHARAQWAAPVVAATGRGWRPAAARPAPRYASAQSFRPASYGRQLARVEAPVTGSEKLPGWVTTYQEPAATLDCYWCNGS